MALSRNNVITHGASGMLGGVVVFRTIKGKTYICNRPKKPTRQSVLQKENRTKFRRATAFAKQMMADPSKKAEYWDIAKRLNLPNAYTAAITEYMRKPEIESVDTTEYSGNKGEQIKTVVRKKGFEVELVEVLIMDKNGKTIEKGSASKGPEGDWIYTTSVSIENKKLLELIMKIQERTGNKTYIKRPLCFNN
jgi:hypothetical protein